MLLASEHHPQPVIPLPLPDTAMEVPAVNKRQARTALGLPDTASVVL